MPASIHFICRGRKNLTVLKQPTYTTGFWSVSEDVAQKLVGGMINLHETKADPSYFGGRVLEWLRLDNPIVPTSPSGCTARVIRQA